MTTTTEKILERAAHYERLAAALRLAAHELNGHRVEKKQAAGVGAMLSAAVELREQQRASVPRSTPKPARAGTFRERVAARKAQVQALLRAGSVSVTEVRAQLPEPLSKSRITQILVALGARKIGTGRTVRWGLPGARARAKSTPAKKAKTWKRVTAAEKQARRARSAALLAKLDLTEPRPLSSTEKQGVSILTQQGYLRKKGGGYIRTAKEFVV